jgi:hypothetical protein
MPKMKSNRLWYPRNDGRVYREKTANGSYRINAKFKADRREVIY